VSARPAEPDEQQQDLRIDAEIVESFLQGQSTELIARRYQLSRRNLYDVLKARGWPDRDRMRRALSRLKREIGAADDGVALEDDHPAFERAMLIATALRDFNTLEIQAISARCDPAEVAEILTAFAALVRLDTDVQQAAEFMDLAPEEWSDTTVLIEADRWRDGARDRTAVAGHEQDGRP
jgi:hypothetical protein